MNERRIYVQKDDAKRVVNRVSADTPPGTGWTVAQGDDMTVPLAGSRVVSGEVFLSLWRPTEIAAAWAADPRLMQGAMRVLAQDSANLDSPECHALLDLAVAKGVLTTTRRDAILRGEPA